jgi:hypothetical protein
MAKTLIPMAGTIKENLENSPTALDLEYGGEDGGMVTIHCISNLLYDEWFAAYSDIYENRKEFNLENVTDAGVHRDDEIYSEGDENFYTIVVPYDFLTREMIEEEINKLNEEYGEDFELPETEQVTIELQKQRREGVELA